MRLLLAVSFLVACSSESTSEPKTGAFDPDAVVTTTAKARRISVHQREVPLAEMPMGRWLIGIPMHGMAEVDIDVEAPIVGGTARYSKAHGTIAMGCATGCTIGNDKAKIDFAPDMQLEFGHLTFDKFDMRMTVGNGHAKLDHWAVESPDLKLTIDLDITLADDFSQSTVDGCVRFAAGAGLADRQPKTATVISLTGANLDRDNLYSIKISGTIGATKRLAQACGAGATAVN
jgi:hypothetical protein